MERKKSGQKMPSLVRLTLALMVNTFVYNAMRMQISLYVEFHWSYSIPDFLKALGYPGLYIFVLSGLDTSSPLFYSSTSGCFLSNAGVPRKLKKCIVTETHLSFESLTAHLRF